MKDFPISLAWKNFMGNFPESPSWCFMLHGGKGQKMPPFAPTTTPRRAEESERVFSHRVFTLPVSLVFKRLLGARCMFYPFSPARGRARVEVKNGEYPS